LYKDLNNEKALCEELVGILNIMKNEINTEVKKCERLNKDLAAKNKTTQSLKSKADIMVSVVIIIECVFYSLFG